jgi:protein TonB
MKTLATIQNELRDLVPQGNDLVLAAMKKTLKPGTDKYNDYLALEGRYQDVSRQLLQGVVSNEDATLEFNKIRQAIIEFIDDLKASDILELASNSTTEPGMADVYNGEVLYRIPKKMQLGIEEECVVRLAFDRAGLIKDFQVEVGDVMKDLRISDVMGVELLDPTADKAFTITTLHDTIQFVEKDLVTEWIFCVTPLKEGQFPLVLKISIIEIINGIERKRNEVLKEQVEILTQIPPADEPVFVSAGYTWQVTGADEQRAISGDAKSAEAVSPQPAPNRPSNSGKAAAGLGFIGKVIAGVATAVIGGVVLYNVSDLGNKSAELPTEIAVNDAEWEGVRKRRSRQELEAFTNKYPGTNVGSQALNLLDTLENEAWEIAIAANNVDELENYLTEYPTGKYANKAAEIINELNRGDIAAVDSLKLEVDSIKEQEEQKPIVPIVKKVKKPIPPKKTPNKSKPKPDPAPSQPSQKPTNKPVDPKPVPPKPAPTNPNEPVAFVSAARKPVFKNCGDSNKTKEEKCTADKIFRYLSNRFDYPKEAAEKSIQGSIVVSFVVERDGSITDVKALNDIGGGCAKEAVRLIKSLPKFKPGLNVKGNPIRVQYTQPVTFKLEK